MLINKEFLGKNNKEGFNHHLSSEKLEIIENEKNILDFEKNIDSIFQFNFLIQLIAYYCLINYYLLGSPILILLNVVIYFCILLLIAGNSKQKAKEKWLRYLLSRNNDLLNGVKNKHYWDSILF